MEERKDILGRFCQKIADSSYTEEVRKILVTLTKFLKVTEECITENDFMLRSLKLNLCTCINIPLLEYITNKGV